MTRHTIDVGVQPGTKLLHIERIPHDLSLTPAHDVAERASRIIHAYMTGHTPPYSPSGWMVWLHADRSFTCGTYLLLHDDGSIERVTAEPDGTEDVFTVKGKDNGVHP